MIIIEETDVSLPSYFRRDEISPRLEEDGLHIFSGSEDYGPGVGSYVILNDEDLTSIFIGYYFGERKRKKSVRGGQFWRHYKSGSRVEWRELEDPDRSRIIAAERPTWARAPGKLKANRYEPRHHEKIERDSAGAIVGYKYLLWFDRDQVFRSAWAPKVTINGEEVRKIKSQWIDGSLEADRIPTEENGNGIYAAKTFDSPVLKDYHPVIYSSNQRYILVRLLLSGIVIEDQFRYRAERADILQVMNDGEWIDFSLFMEVNS